ncbi:unnamed protein product [Polarella glacialis]|uniref:C3H1-type domain-containing protein n=1 Tax=Polarella glacialis TaxID=89957 RepID=A0A813H971_POLGL|nr:unnamed protein product [Polarella glacialis]
MDLQFQPSVEVKSTFVHRYQSRAFEGWPRGCSAPVPMSAMTQPAMPAECKDAIATSVPGEEFPQQGSCLSKLLPTDKMEAHRLGVCVPCSYFAWKVDGCRQGDACDRCHFCTLDEAKSRKRQMRVDAKQSKATAQAEKQCGNNQAEVQGRDVPSKAPVTLARSETPGMRFNSKNKHINDFDVEVLLTLASVCKHLEV